MAERSERTAEEREAARRERERRRAGVFNEPDPFDDFADVGAEDRRPHRGAAESAPAPADPLPPISPPARAQASRRVAASQTEPPPTEAYEIGDAPSDPFDHGTEGAADAPHAAGRDDDPGDFEDEPSHDPGAGDDGPLFEDEVPSGTRRVSRLQADGPGRRRPAGRTRGQRRPGRPPRERTAAKRTGRSHSWVGRGVAAVVLLIVAAIIWLAVEVYQPFGTSPHGSVTVVVPARTGAHQIGNLLARQGVIPSGFFFELRATLAGDRGKLRSGTYHLQEGMSYGAVLTKLTTPPPVAKTSDLTITPGHTRGQVSALLHKQGLKGSYLAATRSSPLLDPHAYGAPRSVRSLEGFLFPDTFRLVDPVKISALVDDQLRDFKQHFAQVNLGYARSKHLTAYDVLTIASLISGEAATTHDLPLVSSVIYNRLRDGMPLGLDSTTRYATGNFTGPLTDSQLHSPSPYNTRVHTGLPPTPIDSPSMADIQAAAHPAQTNYLYFFTKPCTNRSVFATNYTQFLNLVAADRRTHC